MTAATTSPTCNVPDVFRSNSHEFVTLLLQQVGHFDCRLDYPDGSHRKGHSRVCEVTMTMLVPFCKCWGRVPSAAEFLPCGCRSSGGTVPLSGRRREASVAPRQTMKPGERSGKNSWISCPGYGDISGCAVVELKVPKSKLCMLVPPSWRSCHTI